MSKEFKQICKLEDLPEGSKKAAKIDGTMVLVCHHKGELYAVSNVCSHQTRFLHTGRIRNCRVTCPLHGAQFDLKTGEALCLPATKPIDTYEVRVVDGWIEVAV